MDIESGSTWRIMSGQNNGKKQANNANLLMSIEESIQYLINYLKYSNVVVIAGRKWTKGTRA